MIDRAAKGARKERERIDFYKEQGWKLLARAVRTKYQREDLGGAWDFWMARFRQDDHNNGVEWMFVQVGSRHDRAKKIRTCREWVVLFGLPHRNIHYLVETYGAKGWISDEVSNPKQL